MHTLCEVGQCWKVAARVLSRAIGVRLKQGLA